MSLASSDFEDAGFDNAEFDDGLEAPVDGENVRGKPLFQRLPIIASRVSPSTR